jgi:hypothetical protein
MDLKALMQTLETIDKKQNLMEAEKKETTWTDKSGKKHPATQVKGDKYTGKEAEKEDKKKADEGISFTSGIAQALLREFGLEEAPVTNPWANDPAKSAAWSALSPQDQAWLGGADPTDPYILRRAPNKGKSVLPTGMTQAQVDQAKNATEPDAVAQAPTGGQAAQPAAPVSNGMDEKEPGWDTKPSNGMDEKEPGWDTKTPPAEKKKQMAPVDPGTQELQKWIASKGYNIGAAGADGRLGPNTNKALDAFMADWKAGKISEPDKQQYQQLLGGAKDTAWTKQWFAKANAASGGQAAQPAAGAKGPTVAAAQGQAPGNPLNQKPGQAAQPATNPKAAEIDAQLEKYKQYPQSNAQIIARLEKEKAALTGGQAAQPAATAPGSKPGLGSAPARTPLAQPAAAPAAGGQAAQPAGKVDLSVNNPAMNPANNAPLPVPGAATGGQQSPQQMLAQKEIDRLKAKAAAVAPDGNGSGTLQGGQVARESVRNEDDAILQRIRNALYR